MEQEAANELPKAYDPKATEAKLYQFWENHGFFRPDNSSNKPSFCLTIPPPNVTGNLHMGHALGNTLQDIIVRWKRMSGFATLWIPGTDHAGIATQTVVERHLLTTQKKRRKDYSREEFLKEIWAWKEKSECNIIQQIKRLGCSCDWSRLRFTMDNGCNLAVRKVFKKLYEDKLIYRGDYLVNWDPVTQTAIADDEVEREERNSFLWYFTYPVKEGGESICIATTRPETMLGDTAVAVSPHDPRYQHLIGKTVLLPLMDREIPIISDYIVDREFGTGAVKITPAHDPTDHEIGRRHQLPLITIMTPDGRINENGGSFAGLTMEEARKEVVKQMQSLGLLEKIEPHVHRIGFSYRSKAVIEPYLSKQWFVRMDGFSKILREVVLNEQVQIIPKSWVNTYLHWIDNLRDWCISRQLWWGHRIPIWYHRDDPKQMICYEGEGVPPEVSQAPEKWIQDEDVLDTWFSSALWPFSTLGWPEETPDLTKFYPNSMMINGHDILFFWVARMVMMGKYVFNKPPFPKVYLHSLIFGKSYWRNDADGNIRYVSEEERASYDLGTPLPSDVQSKWEKMSKSKGNVIDPLKLIDQYGTDAMRMALASSASQGWQIDLDVRRFEEFKNFANKVWNGARFVFGNLQGLEDKELSIGINKNLFTLEDHWILSTLSRTIVKVNEDLENFRFDEAAIEAYEFFWKEFCSYYLELVKPCLFGKTGSAEQRKNKQKLLLIVLMQSLLLMHPMVPYITEELFQLLKKIFPNTQQAKGTDPYSRTLIEALNAPACMVAQYPKLIAQIDIDPVSDLAFSLLREMVYQVRNIRGAMQIPPGTPIDLYIVVQTSHPHYHEIVENLGIIKALVRIGKITLTGTPPALSFCSSAILQDITLTIPMPDELRAAEKERLSKEREKLSANCEKLNTQLQNVEFASKAPEQLVAKQRKILQESEKRLQEIKQKIDLL